MTRALGGEPTEGRQPSKKHPLPDGNHGGPLARLMRGGAWGGSGWSSGTGRLHLDSQPTSNTGIGKKTRPTPSPEWLIPPSFPQNQKIPSVRRAALLPLGCGASSTKAEPRSARVARRATDSRRHARHDRASRAERDNQPPGCPKGEGPVRRDLRQRGVEDGESRVGVMLVLLHQPAQSPTTDSKRPQFLRAAGGLRIRDHIERAHYRRASGHK